MFFMTPMNEKKNPGKKVYCISIQNGEIPTQAQAINLLY